MSSKKSLPKKSAFIDKLEAEPKLDEGLVKKVLPKTVKAVDSEYENRKSERYTATLHKDAIYSIRTQLLEWGAATDSKHMKLANVMRAMTSAFAKSTPGFEPMETEEQLYQYLLEKLK